MLLQQQHNQQAAHRSSDAQEAGRVRSARSEREQHRPRQSVPAQIHLRAHPTAHRIQHVQRLLRRPRLLLAPHRASRVHLCAVHGRHALSLRARELLAQLLSAQGPPPG